MHRDLNKKEIIDIVKNTSGLSIDEREKYLASLMKGYTKGTTGGFPKDIYRARINENDKLYLHISKLKYPPSDRCSQGRGNYEGQPVFYGSEGPHAAIKEKIADKNVQGNIFITVTKWGLKDVSQKPSFFSLGLEASKLLKTRGLSQNKHPKEFDKENILIDKFLNEEFTRSDSYYDNSAAIANICIFREGSISGIIYPSKVCEYQQLNIELTPDAIDKFYTPQEVTLYMTHPDVLAVKLGGGEIESDSSVRWTWIISDQAISGIPKLTLDTKNRISNMERQMNLKQKPNSDIKITIGPEESYEDFKKQY